MPAPVNNLILQYWHKQRALFLAGLLLALVTVAVFWPVHDHGFIELDDPDYVTGNSQVQKGVTGETLRWAFTQAWAANWHPLTWISHMVDCQLFGLKAGKHHLVNVAFHAANSVLLLLLLHFMT